MSSENTRRIAKNTAMLYIRMLLTMAVSLYTSRVVLNVLGVEDYGIYNVVGGIVVMFGFLNSSISIAVQRYLSFEIGRNNYVRLKQIFSLSLIVHLFLAVFIAALAELFGYWLLVNYLHIPEGSFDGAVWIFHFSIIACCMNILRVPYNAVIIAREKMDFYAYVSIAEVVMNLGVVYLLYIGNADKLKLYSMLVAGVACVITFLYAVYCRCRFEEARFRRYWNGSLFRELVGFAGWSAMGELAWAATQQGVNLVLNVFFNPVVNAARAISVQVSGAILRFVSSFQMAVNPQLIKYYAAGEKEAMFRLLFRSTSFSLFLFLFFAIPILIEMPLILRIWLKEVPEYTVLFCRMSVLNMMLDLFSNLLATLAKAYGKIRKYQTVVSFVLFLNLPLSYAVLKTGAAPVYVFYVYGILSVVLLVIRLWLLRRMVGLPVVRFLREIVAGIAVGLVAFILPACVHLKAGGSFGGLVAVCAAAFISIAICVYFLGLRPDEKEFVKRKIVSIYHRVR